MSSSSDAPDPPLRGTQLNGWKEIAAYLGRSVRTVQRWEKDFGLPVRRFGLSKPESVFAIQREIDAWLLTSQAASAKRVTGATETSAIPDEPPKPLVSEPVRDEQPLILRGRLARIKAGVDAVIVTDHNVLVQGVEGYYRIGRDRVLLLIGEEIHDQDRDPQKNLLLVFNANRDLSHLADDPQTLINGVNDTGGLSFIAHPRDPEEPAFNETDISGEDWQVRNYTGIELWNGLSELKTVVPTKLHGAFYAFFPQFIGHQPIPETLQRWDELLSDGRRVVAIGGSVAHALHMHRSMAVCAA